MKAIKDLSRPGEYIFKLQEGEEDSEALHDQLAIFAEAATIYAERNASYNDNWRRYGWRGCLYDLRRKVERAWDLLWDLAPTTRPMEDGMGPPVDSSEAGREMGVSGQDDLLDAANYAAIAVRAVREGNRDGTGGWWS